MQCLEIRTRCFLHRVSIYCTLLETKEAHVNICFKPLHRLRIRMDRSSHVRSDRRETLNDIVKCSAPLF